MLNVIRVMAASAAAFVMIMVVKKVYALARSGKTVNRLRNSGSF